jgi:aminoglycoside phosphotransferase (APT) family kinase protein
VTEIDATGLVRKGDELDWLSLEKHLRAHLDLPDDAMGVHQFTSGRANLTYLLDFGDLRLVLRRPPRGDLAPGSHDMQREYRVLSKLWRSFPRAPRALHYGEDASVIGAPFLIEEYRHGVVVSDAVPDALSRHPDAARRICGALVDAMADLHQVDVGAAELGEAGRPEGFADRQVSGWLDRWQRAAPSDATPLMKVVGAALAEQIPAPNRVSVVHNDLKLDNCQFEPDDPDHVAAIFDWDMATIGDPLFDLANLLMSSQGQSAWVLSDDEAVERYAARSCADVSGLSWYQAFARWRTGVVVQQLYNRYANGESADERLAAMGQLVPSIAESALSILRERAAE